MTIIPKPLRSKTINLGLLLALAGWLQADMHVFTAHLSPEQQGYATSLVGLVVIVLRYLTDRPVSDK